MVSIELIPIMAKDAIGYMIVHVTAQGDISVRLTRGRIEQDASKTTDAMPSEQMPSIGNHRLLQEPSSTGAEQAVRTVQRIQHGTWVRLPVGTVSRQFLEATGERTVPRLLTRESRGSGNADTSHQEAS